MPGHNDSDKLRVAVVGGGCSGALFCVQLAREARVPVAIEIIEPRSTLGTGVAYSTRDPAHRVNVPAAKMTAFREHPEHFVEWMRQQGEPADDPEAWCSSGHVFPQRSIFGRYVASLVETARRSHAGVSIEHVRDSAIAIEHRNGVYVLRLAGGGERVADLLVLAATHPSVTTPRVIALALGEDALVIRDLWNDDAFNTIAQSCSVLILGTALSMADAVASLDRRGHKGKIIAVSRRGLLSRAHAKDPTPTTEYLARVPTPSSARKLLRAVRVAVASAERAGHCWQAVLDEARACAPRLWGALTLNERLRFLRHVRAYWDAHRYRVAPQVNAAIQLKLASGSLEVLAGSVLSVRRRDDRLDVTLRPRRAPQGAEICRTVDVIVVTTGPDHSAVIERNPAYAALARERLIRADPTGLGIEVDELSRAVGADGCGNTTLFVAGPLARGRFGELMGFPQLAEHAEAVAIQVAAWLDTARRGRAAAPGR